MNDISYANIVGFVMYVLFYTLLDIVHVVIIVRKFMSTHG